MGKNKRKTSSTRIQSGKQRTAVAEVSNRHEKNSWRNNSRPVKYHGLRNQGATCYLNSVLQVLFMTEDFRAAVESDVKENPDHDCIDRHLSSLFADLKEREAYTCKITQELDIIRVYEQQDAAEYFEKILRLSRSGASQIFHGQLTHKTICSGCSAEADRDGAFWYLPLALVDSNSEYSVVDGIENYFRPSEFSGDNQIYCNKCQAKSDATIKRVIRHHPDVLMLLLKRFEFNYSYMTYVKINRTVEVPFTLQIPENQTYELYAVVDHYGSLISGHYTATIKDDEGWYTFNDSRVTLSDYQPFQDDFERSSSAYLLFYRKINDNREVSTPRKKRKTEGAEVGLTLDLCNDEQPERKEKSLMKYPVDYQDNEDNAREDLRGTQEAGQDEDERSPEGEKLFELQDNRREGDSEESMAGDDQTRKQDSSRMSNIPEQQRQDKIYVKEHEDGDYKHVEDQNNEGNIRQNQPEQTISVAYTKQKVEGVKRQTEEQGNTREEQVRDKADSSLRGAGSTGSNEGNTRQKQPEQKISVTHAKQKVVGVKRQPEEHGNTREEQVRDKADSSLRGAGSTGSNEGNTRQKQPEQKISVTHAKQKVVGVKRQTEEHGNTREEQVRDKADSSLRGAGSAGSRRMTENQRVGADEKTRMREEAKEAEKEVNVTMVTEMKEKRNKDGDYKHSEPERKGNPLKKHPNRDVQYKDNEVSARHNMNEDLGGSLKVKQGDDVKPVSVQEQGDEVTKEEKTVESDEQDTKGEKGAHEKKSTKWWHPKKQHKQKKKKKKKPKKPIWVLSLDKTKEETKEKRRRDFRFISTQMNMVNIFPLVYLLKSVRVSFGIVVFFSFFGLVSSLL